MSGFKLLEDSSNRADQPLGLTVHSIPAPEQAMDLQARRSVGGRWKMLVVLLICAAPVVASYFTYYVVRPEGRRNFGELINPQRPLPDQVGIGDDGPVRPPVVDGAGGIVIGSSFFLQGRIIGHHGIHAAPGNAPE
jgi:hypothetical protein